MSTLRMLSVSLAIGLSTGLSGCATHLATLPDRDQTKDIDVAVVGMPYSLPMLQYKTKVSSALTACGAGKQSLALPDGTKLELDVVALEFSATPTAEPRHVPGERYVVDYQALGSPMKVTAFSIGYHPNGILKSINVSADDQTGEVVKQAVKTGLAVATLAGGAPNTLSASGSFPGPANALSVPTEAERAAADAATALRKLVKPLTVVRCTDQAVSLLKAAEANTAARETATDALKGFTRQVERLSVIANLKTATAEDAAQLSAALEGQALKTAEIAALAQARAKIDAKLSGITTAYWPRGFNDRGPEALLPDEVTTRTLAGMLTTETIGFLDPKDLKAWLDGPGRPYQEQFRELNKAALKSYFDDDGKPLFARPADDCAGAVNVSACVQRQLKLLIVLREAETGLKPCLGGAPETPECSLKTGFTNIPEAEAGPGMHWPDAPTRDAPLGRRARDAALDRGVFVRPPAEGKVTIYREVAGKPDEVALDLGVVSAPQLGQLRYLPFANGPFEANALTLALKDDGSIESFEYKNTRAVAAAALAAAADTLGQYQTWKKDQAAAVKTAREEEIAALQFQIDGITKQKELVKLQTPAAEDPLAATKEETSRLDTETALLNAKLAKLKAEQLLADAGG